MIMPKSTNETKLTFWEELNGKTKLLITLLTLISIIAAGAITFANVRYGVNDNSKRITVVETEHAEVCDELDHAVVVQQELIRKVDGVQKDMDYTRGDIREIKQLLIKKNGN